MSPELDQGLVFGVIGLAVGYLSMRFFRKKQKGGACSSGCCGTSKTGAKNRSRPAR